jgi:hypothetical protein
VITVHPLLLSGIFYLTHVRVKAPWLPQVDYWGTLVHYNINKIVAGKPKPLSPLDMPRLV